MCALIRSLALVFLLPMCASAQPAPTVVSTLRTTNTGDTSVCVGANNAGAPTSCTGGLKAGNTLLSGLQENTGLVLNALLTSQPSIILSNASTGLLSGLYATNAKGLILFTNGQSTQAVSFASSGDATFSQNATVTGALAAASAGIGGNATIAGTLAVGTGAVGVFTVGDRSGFTSSATSATGGLTGGAYGTGALTGNNFAIGQNSSGNGAAGTLTLFGRTNGENVVWADSSGRLRVGTAAPQEDGAPSDTSGTVVGDQTATPGILTVADGVTGVLTVGDRIGFTNSATSSTGALTGGAYGTGALPGNMFSIGQNSSGNGAAGTLVLFGRTNGENFLWADASGTPGVLRISNAAPEEDGTPADTSGTIVGSQSSTLDTKTVIGAGVAPELALATILRTPIFRFAYNGGAYSGTVFDGIAADVSPEFAMDPDAKHPNGRSFNPVNGLGYTIQAIKALQAEIDELRALVETLRQEPR